MWSTEIAAGSAAIISPMKSGKKVFALGCSISSASQRAAVSRSRCPACGLSHGLSGRIAATSSSRRSNRSPSATASSGGTRLAVVVRRPDSRNVLSPVIPVETTFRPCSRISASNSVCRTPR